MIDNSLSKLVEIAGGALGNSIGASTALFDQFGQNGRTLQCLLQRKNGFFAFESAYRQFPFGSSEDSWGLFEWNSPELWKSSYQGLACDLFCFGEDVFGDQFCLYYEKVYLFNVETGEIEFMADSLDEWAQKMLVDYEFLTGQPIAHKWQAVHGPLASRYRLTPKRPFVLGGGYELSNLAEMESKTLMVSMGQLARQLRNVPMGSEIEIVIGSSNHEQA